jgi:hypothetical protein
MVGDMVCETIWNNVISISLHTVWDDTDNSMGLEITEGVKTASTLAFMLI